MTDIISYPDESVTVETEFAKGGGVVAVYFRIAQGEVARTLKTEAEDVFVDLDADRRVIGIEMINPAAVTLKKVFKKLTQQFNLKRDTLLPPKQLEKVQELLSV